ncbi:TPA: zinc-ribbon domain-containing protein [Klebsiella oxytoca]|uniref:Zinc-ribbon domain-containing protein n=1 Tax=Klebsiella oxytoca TaxID=571 RepID=A0AAN5LDW2_KLEOX|nr:zinc-ribbon domain-containing protein [Klebsiella oxytoca]
MGIFKRLLSSHSDRGKRGRHRDHRQVHRASSYHNDSHHYNNSRNYQENGTDTGQVCPHCQKTNTSDARFCSFCGGTLIVICPGCHQTMSPSAIFCSKCGTQVSAESKS